MDIGIGVVASIILLFFLAIFILGLITVGIILWINKKKYKHTLPLTRNVGGATIKVATYKAKDYKVGRSGDKLWYVAKAKKYLSPATLQTAKNEYTHHEGSDGEWRNVQYPNVDEKMKEMGVHFVKQDMRAGRIAIGDILENRFKNKESWWDKYGNMVTQLIFYLITTMFLVIGFYQWGEVVGKISGLLGQIEKTEQICKGSSIVPAMILMMIRRRKQ